MDAVLALLNAVLKAAADRIAAEDVETDVLTLVVVAPIAVLDVIVLALEAVKRLAVLLVLNSVQALALWDALVTVIMVALAKKLIN